jgi:uncharacterized phage protein (TIGR01671 family)
MNREIKFRIWNRDAEQWYEPVFEAYKGLLFELLLTTSGELCERSMQGFTHESRFPGKYVIQQYTGLKDKNGKEIYEGDILSVDVETETEKMTMQDDYLLAVVKWNHAGFWASVETDEGEALTEIDHDTIVIGNIYENPELLAE